ncbi:MAG: transposase [Azovibrio sp.]
MHGLFQCDRRNMEQMAEPVAGSHYQRLHHMLSESSWSRAEVRQQLIVDANSQFGHSAALVFDESAFAKKGEKSVGVARQWNGRLGKTENSPVGVFAALVRDRALVDGELFVPEHWFDDPERCREAGIPQSLEFRTKGQIALDLLLRLWREGLHYSHVVFDAGYGHLPWLLNELDDEGETFLAEIHADQGIYLENPLALMFLAKERLAHRKITAGMLSCHDLIDILRHKLPRPVSASISPCAWRRGSTARVRKAG